MARNSAESGLPVMGTAHDREILHFFKQLSHRDIQCFRYVVEGRFSEATLTDKDKTLSDAMEDIISDEFTDLTAKKEELILMPNVGHKILKTILGLPSFMTIGRMTEVGATPAKTLKILHFYGMDARVKKNRIPNYEDAVLQFSIK